MTTAVEERVVLDLETEDDPNIVHIVCHCTNDDIAYCGWTKFDNPVGVYGGDDTTCPLGDENPSSALVEFEVA